MLADLEAVLHGNFTPENLSAYGDYLLVRDDPRGELVALDLDAQPPRYDQDARVLVNRAW